MNKLKDLWLGMDMVNRVLLIAALAASVWSLIMGQGLYGVLLMVVVGFLMITRSRNSVMRRSRLFGTMYFPMPDGELVPRAFEQVKTEYVHGAQSSYDGRTVELRFPWWYLNSAGLCWTRRGVCAGATMSAWWAPLWRRAATTFSSASWRHCIAFPTKSCTP